MGTVFQPTPKSLEVLHDMDLQYLDLAIPSGAEFVEGEWVGEAANGSAVKLTNGTTIVRPILNLAPSTRNDIVESGKLMVARGKVRIRTKVFKSGDTYTPGANVVVITDGASSGLGKGVLAAVPVAAGTYIGVGEVVAAPDADGYLTVDLFADHKSLVVS